MLVDAATYVNGQRLPTFELENSNGFSWIGLLDPKFEEIQQYQNHYSLHPLAVEDAIIGR